MKFGLSAFLSLVVLLPGCQSLHIYEPTNSNSMVMDDDGDGISNARDTCSATDAHEPVGPDGCPVSLIKEQVGNIILFHRGSAKITPKGETVIFNLLSAEIREFPSAVIEVEGYADVCGSDAADFALSELRAKNVAEHMISNGLDASRIRSVVGFGHRRPSSTTPSKCDQPFNDRVVIVGKMAN